MLLDKEAEATLLQQRTRDEYAFYEYPKALYRDRPKGFKPLKEGNWVPDAPFETVIVEDVDGELAALDQGYRTTPYKAG